MEFHKVWQEQCEATRTIRERFGVKSALDYLVGENQPGASGDYTSTPASDSIFENLTQERD